VLTWWLSRAEVQLPPGTSWLSAAEHSRAAGLRYTKRRTDFLLSRWTLKLAVTRVLNWPDDEAALARIEGRPAADGAPELYVDEQLSEHGISLTDRAGCAACLVADERAAIGCDLELVEARSAAFVRDYLTGPERDLVSAAGPARDVAANVVWSAKESALKVLRTGLRRDTRSVEVTVDNLTPPEHAWSPLRVRVAEDVVLGGWWRRSGSFVLTVCGPGGPGDFPAPVGLDAVSPLDGAAPAHHWLRKPLA
jgi:4'-phosphopantetheinyl transferase